MQAIKESYSCFYQASQHESTIEGDDVVNSHAFQTIPAFQSFDMYVRQNQKDVNGLHGSP